MIGGCQAAWHWGGVSESVPLRAALSSSGQSGVSRTRANMEQPLANMDQPMGNASVCAMAISCKIMVEVIRRNVKILLERCLSLRQPTLKHYIDLKPSI